MKIFLTIAALLIFVISCSDNKQEKDAPRYYGFDVENYNHDALSAKLVGKHVYIWQNNSHGITSIIVKHDDNIYQVRNYLVDEDCVLLAEYSLSLLHRP